MGIRGYPNRASSGNAQLPPGSTGRVERRVNVNAGNAPVLINEGCSTADVNFGRSNSPRFIFDALRRRHDAVILVEPQPKFANSSTHQTRQNGTKVDILFIYFFPNGRPGPAGNEPAVRELSRFTQWPARLCSDCFSQQLLLQKYSRTNFQSNVV